MPTVIVSRQISKMPTGSGYNKSSWRSRMIQRLKQIRTNSWGIHTRCMYCGKTINLNLGKCHCHLPISCLSCRMQYCVRPLVLNVKHFLDKGCTYNRYLTQTSYDYANDGGPGVASLTFMKLLPWCLAASILAFVKVQSYCSQTCFKWLQWVSVEFRSLTHWNNKVISVSLGSSAQRIMVETK